MIYDEIIGVMDNLNKKRVGGYVVSTKQTDKSVAIAKKRNAKQTKYIDKDAKSKEQAIEVAGDSFFFPLIPNKRFVCVFSGVSGDGKTLSGSVLIYQYHQMYPKRPIFYVSPNTLDGDISLKNVSKFMRQIDTAQFADLFNDENTTDSLEKLSDSLFLIDDTDDEKKQLFTAVNKLTNIGRKFNISLIFISHHASRLNKTSIYKEADMYVCFYNNLLTNRLLLEHRKVSKKTVRASSFIEIPVLLL
jgi:hypothetical protein